MRDGVDDVAYRELERRMNMAKMRMLTAAAAPRGRKMILTYAPQTGPHALIS